MYWWQVYNKYTALRRRLKPFSLALRRPEGGLVLVLQPRRASVGTGRWRGLCKRSPFSRLKWFCFPYQAAVSEANKKGLRASRYFVWHVFILKLPWPLDHLSLCKGGEGWRGGRREPAPHPTEEPWHQAGQLRHERRSGVAVVAGLWSGGRAFSGWCGAFPHRVPALGQGAQPAPRPGPGWREQAAAAVESWPTAKRLHVFLKTVNIKRFQRQCVVALTSYRHWRWNRDGWCSLVRGKHTFSGHFHNLTPEELRFQNQHLTSLTHLLLRYSVSPPKHLVSWNHGLSAASLNRKMSRLIYWISLFFTYKCSSTKKHGSLWSPFLLLRHLLLLISVCPVDTN